MRPNTSSPGSRRFLLRKLHSLSGVVPVGAFLVEHLWTNATALRGQRAFDDAVDALQALPGLPVIELVTIVLPLAFHAGYGVVLLRESQPNVDRYPHGKNWLYVAQRATGIVTLLFVLWHLWEIRVQKWLFGMGSHSFFPVLTAHLSSTWHGVPVLALVYLAGIAAAVFHFANGLWGFAASWGIVTSRAAMRRVRIVGAIVGVTLLLMGETTVLYFAGASLHADDAPQRAATEPELHLRTVDVDVATRDGGHLRRVGEVLTRRREDLVVGLTERRGERTYVALARARHLDDDVAVARDVDRVRRAVRSGDAARELGELRRSGGSVALGVRRRVRPLDRRLDAVDRERAADRGKNEDETRRLVTHDFSWSLFDGGTRETPVNLRLSQPRRRW